MPIVTINITKIYQINTKESTAQILCLNTIYCFRNYCNFCSVSFD